MKKNLFFIAIVFILSTLSGCALAEAKVVECVEEPLNAPGSEMESGSQPDHVHELADEPQTVASPIQGYCGNTQTTIYTEEGEYTFCYDDSVALTDILVNLDYRPEELCKCASEVTVDTEFGKGYGLNLSSGFARCEKGQADLTEEQCDKIREIISRHIDQQ